MEFMPLHCRCDKKGSVPFAQMWRIEFAEEVDDHNWDDGKPEDGDFFWEDRLFL